MKQLLEIAEITKMRLKEPEVKAESSFKKIEHPFKHNFKSSRTVNIDNLQITNI